MDRGQIKAIAKRALYLEGSSQGIHVFLLLIMAGVISSVLCWGFLMLGGIFSPNYENTFVTVGFLIIGTLAASLVGLVFLAMVLHMLIENIKNDRVIRVGDVFSRFTLGLHIKVGLYTLATAAITALPVIVLVGIGSLLAPIIAVMLMLVGYIPAIYLGFTLCFVPLAKIDNPSRSLKECIALSRSLTKGIKLWLFITGLTLIPCYLWNLIPLVGGILFMIKGYPYILLVFTVTFMARVEQAGGTERQDNNVDKPMGQFDVIDVTKSLQDIMVDCIQNARVIEIVRNDNKEMALPIDIVQKNGVMMYNLFLQTPEGVKPVQVRVEEVTDIIPSSKTFNPAQYVTWTPHWTVPRNW